MKFFRHENRENSHRSRRIYALFEIAYTMVDFAAAATFIVGSVLFFFQDLQTAGTWFFLVGSILFAVKPTLRMARELKLASMGDTEDLAERLKDH
ncbi:YrhK family protein [Pseudooceanicola aestuarii]|uniref:YrhK family protein n=1 Tax=Pseudooceanicola aestuarii TaxID=2697319 RepID=UPI0013D30F54|nr:YrhK family protein [Pseudooceanicola aestuarii]